MPQTVCDPAVGVARFAMRIVTRIGHMATHGLAVDRMIDRTKTPRLPAVRIFGTYRYVRYHSRRRCAWCYGRSRHSHRRLSPQSAAALVAPRAAQDTPCLVREAHSEARSRRSRGSLSTPARASVRRPHRPGTAVARAGRTLAPCPRRAPGCGTAWRRPRGT